MTNNTTGPNEIFFSSSTLYNCGADLAMIPSHRHMDCGCCPHAEVIEQFETERMQRESEPRLAGPTAAPAAAAAKRFSCGRRPFTEMAAAA